MVDRAGTTAAAGRPGGDDPVEILRGNAQRALQQGDLSTAHRYLTTLLATNGQDHAAISLMSELQLQRNNLGDAFRWCIRSVNAAPHIYAYKKRFLDIASSGVDVRYSDELANALVACLDTPELSGLLTNWSRLLLADPHFHAAYGLAQRKPFDPANGGFFASLTDFRPLFAPLFLAGVKGHVVYDSVFEEFVTHIRRHLLNDLGAWQKFAASDYAVLASALSHYTFASDFILDTSEEEQLKVDEIRHRIETGTTFESSAVAILACYLPLHRLANAGDVLEKFKAEAPLADVVKVQIADCHAIRDASISIPSLTPIEDDISAKVQQQYEAFPYPLWNALNKESILSYWEDNDSLRKAEDHLRGAKAKILVAGCGTGLEAAIFSTLFPDAAITAVDLSRASLAHAVLKTRELSIQNVSFYHGDILQLGTLGTEFDYISCNGVLHHLENPVQGWKILCGLLKPGGTMRIGLYRRKGRVAVNTIRQLIGRGDYPPTRAGMLRFRKDCPSLADRGPLMQLTRLQDYYHLNMYRDLLFPAREHQFEISEIKEALPQLGLAFEGFFLPSDMLAKYRAKFSDGAGDAGLENWIRFERENSDHLGGICTFWCRKPKPAHDS